MAGRAAQSICRRCARHHRFCSPHRAPGTPAGAFPGLRRNRAGRISHVVAGLPHGRSRIASRARERVNIGNHLRGCARKELPALVDILQEFQVFRTMHRCNRTGPIIVRAMNGTARSTRTGEQPLRAFRLFRIGLWRPARKEALRIVVFLLLRVKSFHEHSCSTRLSADSRQRCTGPAIPSVFMHSANAVSEKTQSGTHKRKRPRLCGTGPLGSKRQLSMPCSCCRRRR